MMIQYALKNSAYLDAAKYWHKVWETTSVKAETDGRGRLVSYNGLMSVDFSHYFFRHWNASCVTLSSRHTTTNSQI